MDHISKVLEGTDITTVAIVGCSKNSGKTTALNHILAGIPPQFASVGILSIGIDGEEQDFWLGVPKPRIRVRAGNLVATAERLLRGGTARVRILQRTGATTPLGELVIARVEEQGLLVLAGVRHKGDVRRVVDAMKRHHAARVLIDGSYQRLMAADPEVSQGVVLATGAILGRTVREVARRTKEVLDRLRVPPVEDPADLGLFEDAIRHNRLTVRDSRARIVVLAAPGAAVNEADLRDAIGRNAAVIATPGVVSDRLLRAVMSAGAGPVRLLVSDPTRLFVSPPMLSRFAARGGEIRVLRPVRLLAVAVNPSSVLGHTLPEKALHQAIQDLADPIPVFLFRDAPDPDA